MTETTSAEQKKAVISRQTWDASPEVARHTDGHGDTYFARRTRDRGTIFVPVVVVDAFPLFPIGLTVMTATAEARLAELEIDPAEQYRQLLDRHLGGDWGLCWVDDLWTNDEAILLGERIFSVYVTDDVEFWVITEASSDSGDPKGPRSTTTLLLPDDY